MQGPSILKIWLLSILAQTLLFGILCMLYPVAIWILLYRRRHGWRSSPNLWLCAIVSVMFLCAGADFVLNVRQLLIVFADHSTTPGGPLAYFQSPGNDPRLYAVAIIFAFLTLLGDGFMIYRVYVVFDRKAISLALPALLFAGDVVTTALVANALLRGNPTSYVGVIYIPGGRPALAAYFSMTLFTNIVTTLLLLGRLWWHDRRVKRYLSHDVRGSVSWRVMKTIVQSQAVYSAGVIFNLVTYLAHSDLALIANGILPSLIGISFTLIIARIGFSEVLGRAPDVESSAGTNDVDLPDRRRRASTPIAFNVFISQATADSEDAAVHDHTKPPSLP